MTRSYYGQPVLKAPVWKWCVPAYFFTGGVAAGTTLLATGARLTGDGDLARRCRFAAFGATAVSAALLIEDLGRPARFLNMLRVAKPSSPMSVGSWVLAGFGGATTVAAAGEVVRLPATVMALAEGGAAVLAPVLGAYTAVLLADTAVPAWREAYRELPFVFTGSALASAAGLASLLGAGRPATRRAAAAGAALELVASRAMARRLGALAPQSRLATLATGATAAGAALSALRRTAPAGGALLLVGGVAKRFDVFRAGVASARDPAATIGPQRARVGGGVSPTAGGMGRQE